MVRADGGVANVEETTRVQGAARKFLDEVGISKSVQAKLFETEPKSMYFLSPSEMAETDITFSRSSAAAIRPVAQVASSTNPLTLQRTSSEKVPTENVRQGDSWSYILRDEITGEGRGTTQHVVTEVTKQEITVRVTFPNNSTKLVVYDRYWNRL